MHYIGKFNSIDASDIDLIIIDLFAGAGGTTTGYVQAKRNGKHNCIVAAAINHDPVAIKSHWINHPEVNHFEEDITTFYGSLRHGIFMKSEQMLHLERLISIYKAFYPRAKVVLWASLECTNFSNAKGGQSRDADSRTLANHLQFYVDALTPDYIKIENVVEFKSWGPLRIRAKKAKVGGYDSSELKMITDKKTGELGYSWTPVEKQKGRDFIAWKTHLETAYGYRSSDRELDSADFGAYTKRNRYFMIFAKEGLPIAWPEPTHAKEVEASMGLFSKPLQKHKAVREVLELEDMGESIFNRKKPLVDNTLERIYHGLIKFVAKQNVKQFLALYYSGRPADKCKGLDRPCPTLTTTDIASIIQVVPAEKVEFIAHYNSKDSKTGEQSGVQGVDEPCRTIAVYGTPQVIQAKAFLSCYHGTGDNVHGIDQPAPTMVAADIHSIVSIKWIDREFGKHTIESIDNPVGSLPCVPKANVISATKAPFIVDTSFGNIGQDIERPIGVITASRKYHYIVNPSFIAGHSTSVDVPCPVVIARQDKSPLYLVSCKQSPVPVAVPVYDTDTPMMIRIKEFMAMYGLEDVMSRMFKVREMKLIQGFPESYVLAGAQNHQKKQLGNAVITVISKCMGETLGEVISKL